jgi:hypothetical protein
MPRSEVAFLATHLFADTAGLDAARRVDRHIDRLPGLAGLHLLEGAVLRNLGNTSSVSTAAS